MIHRWPLAHTPFTAAQGRRELAGDQDSEADRQPGPRGRRAAPSTSSWQRPAAPLCPAGRVLCLPLPDLHATHYSGSVCLENSKVLNSQVESHYRVSLFTNKAGGSLATPTSLRHAACRRGTGRSSSACCCVASRPRAPEGETVRRPLLPCGTWDS